MTAGNASGLNDGAAAVVLMKLDEAKRRNLQPIAKIVGHAQAGVDPKVMGLGPVPAIRNLVSIFQNDKLYQSIGILLILKRHITNNT